MILLQRSHCVGKRTSKTLSKPMVIAFSRYHSSTSFILRTSTSSSQRISWQRIQQISANSRKRRCLIESSAQFCKLLQTALSSRRAGQRKKRHTTSKRCSATSDLRRQSKRMQMKSLKQHQRRRKKTKKLKQSFGSS